MFTRVLCSHFSLRSIRCVLLVMFLPKLHVFLYFYTLPYFVFTKKCDDAFLFVGKILIHYKHFSFNCSETHPVSFSLYEYSFKIHSKVVYSYGYQFLDAFIYLLNI